MPVLFTSMAAESAAALPSSSFNIQPFIVLIVIGLVLFSSFIRAASRKSRSNRAAPPQQTAHPQQASNQYRGTTAGYTGVAHQPANTPYAGTLLNGVPLKSYDSSHGHQTTGFANERMLAEAELKRKLDALDSARRNGQVTAEQYAVHREAIFKNF